MKQVYSLAGRWDLHWNDGERGVRLDSLLGESPPPPLLEASVPGEVHLDLIEAGLLAEPSVGVNCLHARWVEETMWCYRRIVDMPEPPAGATVFLCFEQLDLAARLFVNGQAAGQHANAFRPARFDVTTMLKPGRNVLVVEVEGGLRSVAERPWQGYGLQHSGPLHKRQWLRKTQSSFSWDWAPRLINVGLTGPVRIECCTGVWAEDTVVLATVSDELDSGVVTARFQVRNEGHAPATGQLRVELPGTEWQAECEVRIAPGRQRIEVQVPVDKPQLWWPVGHGAATRYEVQATLTVGGQVVADTRRRTPSFHPVRRAFAPVTVFLAEDDTRIRVFGVNEGPALDAELRWGVCGLAGDYPLDATVRVSLAGNASTPLAEFDRALLLEHGDTTHGAFAVLVRTDGRELARDTLFAPLYREMAWPEAEPTVQWQEGKAIFASPTFAWRVCLDLDGERAVPDNFFDLLPGVPYAVDWPEDLGPPRVLRVGNSLRQISGADT